MAKQKKEKSFRTSIGGQALIEGILMRGPQKQSIVVRKPDGELETKTEALPAAGKRPRILRWPFIRGSVNFVTSLMSGMRAITYSASFLPEDEQEEPSKLDLWFERHFSSSTAEKLVIGTATALGIALAVGLFVILPTLLTGLLSRWIEHRLLLNLIEGLVRVGIFLLYMGLVSRMKEIRRIWQYHGAEHKTIFCYEAGLELTVENARRQSRLHPRCGTSFMVIMILVSMLVLMLVSWSNVWIRLGIRLLLVPVIVGISYELLKLAGRYDNWLTRIISAPGKLMQHLTTAEPEDEMLEVAIAALKEVLPDEAGQDAW